MKIMEMTFQMIKTTLQRKESPAFHHLLRDALLNCIPVYFLLHSFCPHAREFSVDNDHGGGQEAKDDSFP